METHETPPSPAISCPAKISDDTLYETNQSKTQNKYAISEFQSLRDSYDSLELSYKEAESSLVTFQQQSYESLVRDAELVRNNEELALERDGLRDEVRRIEKVGKEREEVLKRRFDEWVREKEGLEKEIYEGMSEREELVKKIDLGLKEKEELLKDIEACKRKNKEMEDENGNMSQQLSSSLQTLSTVKELMMGVCETLDEEIGENDLVDGREMKEIPNSEEDLNSISAKMDTIVKMVNRLESRLNGYQEKVKKEKRELENSVISLTEENRDINSLLRIALVEKEAVEKSLNKFKGNNDQKRVPLLQIAERGLQRVGFGFMMGAAANEQSVLENTAANASNASNVSDGSECEEEVVSLASTVEKIMKNLRLEITQLRKALEESRSEIERLQSLTEKQAQQIAEQTLYVKELEDRETMLTQNVEELLMEIKGTEVEVARWREACELEVEAGRHTVEERDKVVTILQQELEKTRSALEVANSKIKLKEDLAAAAMAAQAAAEKSLQLADSRGAELRERIEELTRQLQEAESRERNSRRSRHICWPWRALKVNPANVTNVSRARNVRRLLPEMQALLNYGT